MLEDVNVYNIDDLIRQLDYPENDDTVRMVADSLIVRGEWAPATVAKVRDAILALNQAEHKPTRKAKAEAKIEIEIDEEAPRPKTTRKR